MSRCGGCFAGLCDLQGHESLTLWKGQGKFPSRSVSDASERHLRYLADFAPSEDFQPFFRFIFVIRVLTARLTTRQDVFAILFVTRTRAKK